MVLKRFIKCAGFSLPELMIAMVVASIVMGIAVGIYIDVKKQYIRLIDKHRINSDQLLIKQIFYNAIWQSGFTTKYGDIYQQLVDNSEDNFGDIFGKMGIVIIGKSPA